MNENQTSLLISLLSVAIAAVALGWNVFRDVFSKPRARVTADSARILRPGRPDQGPYLSISVLNTGPGNMRIDSVVLRDPRGWYDLFNRAGRSVIYDWDENPLSSKIPKWVGVGDTITLLLPWNDTDDCPMKAPMRRLGIYDSFGRGHWVSRKDLAKLKTKYRKDFPKA